MTKSKLQLPDPASAVFVHYLCQEFEQGDRILNLLLVRGDDSVIHRWDITSVEKEAAALEEYFEFLAAKCKGLCVVHWNQCASYFGPAHLNARYTALTGTNANFSYQDPLNLADFLIRKYGDKYIAHPRLDNLAALNNFSGTSETGKNARTFPDQRILLINKIYHAEYHGELKILKHALNAEKTIEDFLVSHKEEIIEYLKTELFKQKGKKVAVVIYALKELSLIDVSERRELYNVLRKLLGEIGTDESMNKVLRDQITQHDYSTQEAIHAQKEKIKFFLNIQ